MIAAAMVVDWPHHAADADASPPAAMTVELATMPSSPPVPPNDISPGPQQVKAAPEPQPVHDVKIDTPPQVDAALKPEFALPIAQKPTPVENTVVAKAAPETTAPPSVQAPPLDKSAAPVNGNSNSAPSDAEQGWEGRLVAKLARSKRYPIGAQAAGQQDTVFVRLVLDRKGRLVEAAIKKSGGFAMLDGETLSLARRASPYPAPPDSIVGDRIVRVVPVEFYIGKRR